MSAFFSVRNTPTSQMRASPLIRAALDGASGADWREDAYWVAVRDSQQYQGEVLAKMSRFRRGESPAGSCWSTT